MHNGNIRSTTDSLIKVFMLAGGETKCSFKVLVSDISLRLVYSDQQSSIYGENMGNDLIARLQSKDQDDNIDSAVGDKSDGE